MRQYLIDELRIEDYGKLKDYFVNNFKQSSGINEIFWIELPHDLLSETQSSHEECKPFFIAVDLEESFLSCELLIRTKKSMRCECIAYADTKQRNWIIDKIDSVFNELKIVY